MRARSRGFSLIEVLVALLVIAVGLLGLAKLQAISYASTGTAALRSLAALQASSLVSAMRANRNYWSNVTTPLTINISGATVTVVTGDSTLANATYDCVYGDTGSNAPCTTAQLAAYDLHYWVQNLSSQLANVTGSINCPTPAAPPTGCWIQLSWFERTIGANNQSLSSVSTAMAAPTYTLYFVP
jgi:type IV pilus assembly protein PilV